MVMYQAKCFIFHYGNDPKGQFLTWNFVNLLKVSDHLHECILHGIFYIGVTF